MSGKITALKAQERRKDRVNVFLDGEYAFSLQEILAAELHLGQELIASQIEALRERDQAENAYERALNYLSFRPRSVAEMRRYLQGKGLQETAVEELLARLARVGLVDDRDFTRFWVGSREATHPKGRYALRSELRQKGIESEVIEVALSGLDEEGSALNAARRTAQRLSSLDEQTFRRRLLGFLQRRGFGYEVSQRVIRQLWDEAMAHPETDPE